MFLYNMNKNFKCLEERGGAKQTLKQTDKK